MGDESYADEYLEVLGTAHPDGVTFQVQPPAYYAEKSHHGLMLTDDYYRVAAKRTKEMGTQFGVGLCDAEKVPFLRTLERIFIKF